MKSVTLGKTGLTVHKMGFGALPIQRISRDDAAAILRRAYEGGINFFDTARFYTDSEQKIHYALGDVRENIVIATKTMSTDTDAFWSQLDASLHDLDCGYIDLYQFHNPPFCPKPGDGTGLYEAMLEAKRRGLIRHIGITNHRLPLAIEAAQSGLYETVQFPFSYLADDREIEFVRMCQRLGVTVIAMKALSGGLITNSAAACAFLMQFDNVVPIWGIQRMGELEEFLSYMDSPPELDGAALSAIEADKKQLGGNFCRGCGYCLPCPQNIEIPTCARMSLLIRRAPTAIYLNEEWQANMRRVEDCTGCNHCKDHCPYGLDTPRLLRENREDYLKFL